MELLQLTEAGLYCSAGDFHIDPWQPTPRAVITHAHADHARPGCDSYLAATAGLAVLQVRLGPDASIQALQYGETITLGRVRLSLHPAGHILGSAQVRLESDGEVWVVSGDYKRQHDATCVPFEPMPCHTYITESTFGLPIYRWPNPDVVFQDINAWWHGNQEAGRASILLGYSLGKAQRLLAGIDSAQGPIYVHGAVERINEAYRQAGVPLPSTPIASDQPRRTPWEKALVVAPPSVVGSPWLRKFGDVSMALASGWMQIRGARRRQAVDRGFVLSDHADWPALLETVHASGAERVLVTHGYSAALTRYLEGLGLSAEVLPTRFEGERLETSRDAVEE
ncbi:MAG: ligase-associated DNA damage response exonuclease [Gemmataceae bacterium]|nr:ligase-associated DNA damage response exonuclease [Gemmataceae bacterium]MCI0742998.1 ligase-associated DNA damage response exonuclease [Gemmataceae bacterium]